MNRHQPTYYLSDEAAALRMADLVEHLRQQSERTLTRHAALAKSTGDHAYALACVAEIGRRGSNPEQRKAAA